MNEPLILKDDIQNESHILKLKLKEQIPKKTELK